MKQLSLAVAVALSLALAACGSSSSSSSTPPYQGFTQPASTVAVNFTVDDSANKVWQANQLEWKGQVQFDKTTRLGVFNSDWNAGPSSTPPAPGWALVYDDGPWDTLNPTTGAPGHEPLTIAFGPSKGQRSVAGDHIWGVTAFIAPPATGQPDQLYGYGLRDATNADRVNGGWVYGNAASFTLKAGDTGSKNIDGWVFPAHGAIDLKLVIDKANIAVTTPPFDTSTITVKGSAWGWADMAVYDDGTHGDDTANDGKYTFVLSIATDPTKPPYPGLLKSGDVAEFVYTLGGTEYKIAGDASPTGVEAFLKSGTTWTSAAITSVAGGLGGHNTAVAVP